MSSTTPNPPANSGANPPPKFPGSHTPSTASGMPIPSDNDNSNYKKLSGTDPSSGSPKSYLRSELTKLSGILAFRLENWNALLTAADYHGIMSEGDRDALEEKSAGDVAAGAAAVGELIDGIRAPSEADGGVDSVKVLQAVEAWEAAGDKGEYIPHRVRTRVFMEMLKAKVEEKLRDL